MKALTLGHHKIKKMFMNWFTQFLTSSIGRKLIMSLTGLFLILFLVVHLAGNLQLLIDDEGRSFNMYSYAMSNNLFIKVTSYGLYLFIVLHAIQGIIIALKNKASRKTRYAVKATDNTSFGARNMAMLGLLLLVFIGIHMGDFWYNFKFGSVGLVDYEGLSVKNVYSRVDSSFSNPILVGFYVLSMIGLAFHLWHGFASAFQTLGLRHSKYTPLIQTVGKIYSILIPALFAWIPLYFILFKN